MELAARRRVAAVAGDMLGLGTLEDVSKGTVYMRETWGLPSPHKPGALSSPHHHPVPTSPRLPTPPASLQLFLLFCNEGRRDRIVLGLTGKCRAIGHVKLRGARLTGCLSVVYLTRSV